MTDLTPEAVEAALDGATPGDWLYRPNEYDDWGYVRSATPGYDYNLFVCQAKDQRVSEEAEGVHRRNGTDPWEHNARLIALAPELAREYLRLKEVEKAAHRMRKAWGDSPTGSPHCSATWEMQAAIAAFAAVEGK